MGRVNNHNGLAEQFESHRNHLQFVAYRILGSRNEADDAVQESWIRLSRSDMSSVENIGGWMTTIVSRVCLDMLRARKSRHEDLTIDRAPEPVTHFRDGSDPEYEALMADAVGHAMLVVLGTLSPAERIAFVLHDIFGMSFADIASILERNEAAARKLASRARQRVKGDESASRAEELRRKQELVDAFLAASRAGDFEKLLSILDPNVLTRNDPAFPPAANAPVVVHGSQAAAKQFAGRAQGAQPALVNGSVGAVIGPLDRILFVLVFTVKNDKITEIEMIADPARLRQLDLALLND